MSTTFRNRFVVNPTWLNAPSIGANFFIDIIPVDWDKTAQALFDFAEFLNMAIGQAFQELFTEGAQIARANAPYRTGNLRANIFNEQISAFVYGLHSMAPYSGFVNFGHLTRGGDSFVPPNPFFDSAREYVTRNLLQRVNQKLAQWHPLAPLLTGAYPLGVSATGGGIALLGE